MSSPMQLYQTAIQQTQYKDDQYQRFTITSKVSHQHTRDYFAYQY